MAVFTLEDLQSAVEVMVFPKAMIDHGHKLRDDAIVAVRGRIDLRDDAPKLMANDIQIVEVVSDVAPPLRLRLPATAVTDTTIDTLKRILLDHPGDSPVFLHLGEGKVMRLNNEFRVDVGRCVGELPRRARSRGPAGVSSALLFQTPPGGGRITGRPPSLPSSARR